MSNGRQYSHIYSDRIKYYHIDDEYYFMCCLPLSLEAVYRILFCQIPI